MAHKFAQIAFTDSVKDVQVEQNSRQGYASMELGDDVNYLLSQREANFISARDTFYMASVSETNWPYVQHRGGPKGFLKIIDAKTIGFADYRGNRQYVSTGNFRKNNRVSIILMDYPNKTRLKILGHIEEVSMEQVDIIAHLEVENHRAPIERGFIIHIEAFDWNCPKYITSRYTEEEISSFITPIVEENQILKAKLAEGNLTSHHNNEVIGQGELPLVVTGIRQLSSQVRAYELRHVNQQELPSVSAGAHLVVPIKRADGDIVQRHYSICSNPSRRDIYEIAVLQAPQSKGGSIALYECFTLGTQIQCPLPSNYFSLAQQNTSPHHSVLIAGGIGITPIKPMAQKLFTQGQDFTLHYAGKSIQEMPYAQRLKRSFPTQLATYEKASQQRMDLEKIIDDAPESSHFYLCGPTRMVEEFIAITKQRRVEPQRIHIEKFVASASSNAKAVTLILKKSNKKLNVAADETLLDALLDANVQVPNSCKVGDCKSCVVKVLDGEVEHQDNALSTYERTTEQLFCPCVSRAKTDYLVLDL